MAINKALKRHTEWYKKNYDRIVERELRILDGELRKDSVHALFDISDSLSMLATCYGIMGTIQVSAGDGGWSAIDRSGSYHFWALRLRHYLFTRVGSSPKLTNYVTRAACSLCYALASALPSWADRQAAVLADMHSDQGMVDEGFWSDRPFEPFALELWRIAKDDATPESVVDSLREPYRSVVTNWRDEALLCQSLWEVCEYHCRHLEDTGEGRIAEFDRSPFDLIPWEVIAVRSVRSRMGLGMPDVEHPLMRLAPPERTVTTAEDPVLGGVERMFRRISDQ